MPAMPSGHLSDISERSMEHEPEKRPKRRPSKVLNVEPKAEAGVTDKSPRRVSIAVGALDRPSRLERQKTPNPAARKSQQQQPESVAQKHEEAGTGREDRAGHDSRQR